MEAVADNGDALMLERQPREKISTRIEAEAARAIEEAAERRRTTPSQVARVLLEDGARSLAGEAR
jgi:hypothetical protein